MRTSRPTLLFHCALRACVAISIAAPLAAQNPAAPYHTVATHTLGGDGGWDYLALDTVHHHLFVARSDRVMVIDEHTGTLLALIPGLHRTHGVAFSYATGHGFVTGSGDSSVTMFDLGTFKVLGSAKADAGADALIFDPATSHIMSFNGGANSSTVFDPRTGARVASIPLGGRPEFAVSDGKGKVFVNLEDSSSVDEIDVKSNTVVRHWALAPCESPSGLAIDVAHHRLFSGCENSMMAVSDYDAGKVVATVPIGKGVDADRYDPGTGLAFSSNGEGTITVVREVSPSSFVVQQTVATAPGARTMELDPSSHELFTVTARFGPGPAQATSHNPRRRPPILPDSFVLFVLGR